MGARNYLQLLFIWLPSSVAANLAVIAISVVLFLCDDELKSVLEHGTWWWWCCCFLCNNWGGCGGGRVNEVLGLATTGEMVKNDDTMRRVRRSS